MMRLAKIRCQIRNLSKRLSFHLIRFVSSRLNLAARLRISVTGNTRSETLNEFEKQPQKILGQCCVQKTSKQFMFQWVYKSVFSLYDMYLSWQMSGSILNHQAFKLIQYMSYMNLLINVYKVQDYPNILATSFCTKKMFKTFIYALILFHLFYFQYL